MQMIYLLHSTPDAGLARRLQERWPLLFGAPERDSEARQEGGRERPVQITLSIEEVLEDLRYGRD